MGQISINPMAVLNEKDIEEGVLMFHSVYNHAVSVHQNTVVFRKGDCFEVVLTVATHACIVWPEDGLGGGQIHLHYQKQHGKSMTPCNHSV